MDADERRWRRRTRPSFNPGRECGKRDTIRTGGEHTGRIWNSRTQETDRNRGAVLKPARPIRNGPLRRNGGWNVVSRQVGTEEWNHGSTLMNADGRAVCCGRGADPGCLPASPRSATEGTELLLFWSRLPSPRFCLHPVVRCDGTLALYTAMSVDAAPTGWRSTADRGGKSLQFQPQACLGFVPIAILGLPLLDGPQSVGDHGAIPYR